MCHRLFESKFKNTGKKFNKPDLGVIECDIFNKCFISNR